ncbi:hypothetical protein [Bifidobacterium callitrichidarum]|uniref:hypothetical protein n=1 Tax=Bifidobacterium callitrichidarum TaxID=2052941 RepID=UPI00130499E1|nr:hypothetical protein [Bifidobacterium callitrichidarum]
METETVADPAAVFEDELREKMDKVYDNRSDALEAADYLETYEGGIGISRKGDGWGLTSLDESGYRSCDLPYDNDGNANYADIDFGMDTPDDYRIIDNMNSHQWENLQPVQDFLNGKTDTVNMYSIMPAGYLQDAEEDEDDYVDASYLTVLCANKGENPEWHSQFQDMQGGNDLVEAVQNNLNTHHGMTAWPDSDDGSIYIGEAGKANDERFHVSLDDNGQATLTRERRLYHKDWLVEGRTTFPADQNAGDFINSKLNEYKQEH